MRKWWILFSMSLLTFMLNIDVTAINIAIPVIAHEFYASLDSMQWVVNAYVLVTSMFQIVGGRLGDTYGHRRVFLLGTTLFVLSSAGAGVSVNEGMLIAFRTLQGLALGIAFPLTIILSFEAFPKKQQGFALSFIVATMGVALAIGPPLGGLLVHYASWRWIFYINIPLGILTLVMASIFCSPHKAEVQRYIDYKGAFFLVLGLFGIMVAVNQVQVWGLASAPFWICFLVGWLSLGVLYLVDRKQSYPIMDFHLFKIRNFTLNNLIRLIVQFIFVPVIFFIPLYLQNISGATPVYSGLLMLFLTVVIGILSPLAGKWVDRIGDKTPNILSLAIFAIACFLFIFLQKEPNLLLLGVGLLLIGISTGITFVSTVTGSVSVAPEEQHGVATGIIMTTAWFGCALGIALFGAILALTSKHYFAAHLTQTLTPSQHTLALRVAQGISPASALSANLSGDDLTQITTLSTQSFLHGLHTSMGTLTCLAILGLFLSFALKKHIPPHHHKEVLPL